MRKIITLFTLLLTLSCPHLLHASFVCIENDEDSSTREFFLTYSPMKTRNNKAIVKVFSTMYECKIALKASKYGFLCDNGKLLDSSLSLVLNYKSQQSCSKALSTMQISGN